MGRQGICVALVARTAPGALAAILFGSVARHEERPLTDSSPSDVDLLIIFMAPTDARLDRKDTSSLGNDSGKGRTGAEDDGLTARQHQVLSDAVVRGLIASPNAARDVNVTGALAHFARWDPWFVEQIARDGILLWARGPLPRGLAPIEVRGRLGKRGQGR